jgi:hypothetical protein
MCERATRCVRSGWKESPLTVQLEIRDGNPDWWASLEITFDPSLPCPLKAQATIEVV